MEKKKFRQNLQSEDLIAFNFYLVDRKAKTTLFPRILGLFIFILGCIDIPKEGANIPMCLFTMAIGVFGMLGLVPLSTYMQKKSIRKKLNQNDSIIAMDVTVFEEGIRFEIPLEETSEEIVEVEQVNEKDENLSDNELRELEYSNDEVAEEASKQTDEESSEATNETLQEAETEIIEEPTVSRIEGERDFQSQKPQEDNNPAAFTVPWGGITSVEETNHYLFINIAGYQSMIVRKDACDTIEEVINDIKENIKDVKRYVVNIKKEKTTK